MGLVFTELQHDHQALRIIAHRSGAVDEHSIPWPDVRSVVAYKIDAVIHDVIVIRLETTPDVVFEVSEEGRGFYELLERLPTYLPGCLSREKILEAVALPPFDRKETLVYRRLETE